MKLKKLDDLGKPYRIFTDHVESGAIDQFASAMQQDCVVQGALMPDCHQGYALPIGAVVACEGMVFPSYVGFDIGCGMCAVPTTFNADEVRANAKAIFDQIYRDVPTGFFHNNVKHPWSYMGDVSGFVRKELISQGKPEQQIGTLGGGNHFIEIGVDAENTVWIIIHSGSRNVGHKIATHYMKAASPDGKAREGHYGLLVDSDLGRDYIMDVAFGLDFALANRRLMIDRIEKAIQRYAPGGMNTDSLINRNHNHVELRNETDTRGYTTGRKIWIHRKGATHAEEGMWGVIPGNMRDGSFIVRGKGNPDSLYSSSHGAGRVLSRTQAKDRLNLDDFKETMEGITARVKPDTIDESPFAYKDIFTVMAEQTDLVEVVNHVKPIINVKG